MASVMLGQLHSIMTRSVYLKIRSLLSTHNIEFPHWKTISRLRKNLSDMLEMKLIETESVLKNKIYTRQIQDIIIKVIF